MFFLLVTNITLNSSCLFLNRILRENIFNNFFQNYPSVFQLQPLYSQSKIQNAIGELGWRRQQCLGGEFGRKGGGRKFHGGNRWVKREEIDEPW